VALSVGAEGDVFEGQVDDAVASVRALLAARRLCSIRKRELLVLDGDGFFLFYFLEAWLLR
jgi:hypothetical protein